MEALAWWAGVGLGFAARLVVCFKCQLLARGAVVCVEEILELDLELGLQVIVVPGGGHGQSVGPTRTEGRGGCARSLSSEAMRHTQLRGLHGSLRARASKPKIRCPHRALSLQQTFVLVARFK